MPAATLGDLKAAIKKAKSIYVWCNWQGDDGDYIEVNKSGFLRSIGADAPFEESGHGGKPNWTPCQFRFENDCVYVN